MLDLFPSKPSAVLSTILLQILIHRCIIQVSRPLDMTDFYQLDLIDPNTAVRTCRKENSFTVSGLSLTVFLPVSKSSSTYKTSEVDTPYKIVPPFFRKKSLLILRYDVLTLNI